MALQQNQIPSSTALHNIPVKRKSLVWMLLIMGLMLLLQTLFLTKSAFTEVHHPYSQEDHAENEEHPESEEPLEPVEGIINLDSLSDDYLFSDEIIEEPNETSTADSDTDSSEKQTGNANQTSNTTPKEPVIHEGKIEKRKWFTYRVYMLGEIQWIINPAYQDGQDGIGVAELSASLEANPYQPITFFVDGLGQFKTADEADDNGFVPAGFDFNANELGMRWQLFDNFSLALGKERDMRAPGLIVSPSDFLLSGKSLPGQEEQRNGIWMTRITFQNKYFNIDGLFLPFLSLNEWGFPDLDNLEIEDLGGALKTYVVIKKLDVGLIAGYYERTWQFGISGAGYIAPFMKIHAEFSYRREDTHLLDKKLAEMDAIPAPFMTTINGLRDVFHERDHVIRALAGMRFDISADSSISFEGYYNGNGLSGFELNMLYDRVGSFLTQGNTGSAESGMSPFIRWWYVIFSASRMNLWDQFHLNFSTIISLEEPGIIGYGHLDWLASDRSTLGLGIMAILGKEDGQYFMRPANWNILAKWRINL